MFDRFLIDFWMIFGRFLFDFQSIFDRFSIFFCCEAIGRGLHRYSWRGGNTPAAPKTPGAQGSERLRKLVGQTRDLGEYEMVRSKNNAGHSAIAMVINLALVAGVFAGMAAAITSMVG